MTFGVTSGGYVIPTFQEIRDEIAAEFKAEFGASINTTPQSRFGILIDQRAEREFKLWQNLESVYSNSFRKTATGIALDWAVSLIGLKRLTALQSVVSVTVTGTAGTVIATNKRVRLDSTGTLWGPTTEITIPGGGSIAATFRAVETGPLDATTGDSFTIETPVFGWSGVTITANATVGRDLETDSELRARSDNALSALGAATFAGLISELLNLEGVTNVGIIENKREIIDGDGRPPHCFETVVTGGTDTEIAQVVWDNKPLGIQTFGSETDNVTDSQGNTQTVNWSRPTAVDIYVDITGTAVAADYPGDSALEQAILDFGNTLAVGDDVLYLAVMNAIYDNIPGMLTLTVELSTVSVGAATVTNIAIGPTEIADFSLANINVSVTT